MVAQGSLDTGVGGGGTFYPGEIFAILAYSVNASPRFVRKCMRSWLTQGSSDWGGGGLTLLPGGTFCYFSLQCKRFATFCKEMYEKLARSG